MLRSLAITVLAAPFISQATTWEVGPGQTYTMPSQVSTLVSNGDTVNIEAGVYPSDVARWQAGRERRHREHRGGHLPERCGALAGR